MMQRPLARVQATCRKGVLHSSAGLVDGPGGAQVPRGAALQPAPGEPAPGVAEALLAALRQQPPFDMLDDATVGLMWSTPTPNPNPNPNRRDGGLPLLRPARRPLALTPAPTLTLTLSPTPAPTLTLNPHPEQLTALVASMRMRELVAGELLVLEGLQP